MDSCRPRISVITPSFNQGHFIEQTIRSVLDQNYPQLEYIVLDGGSTDDSVDVIKRFDHALTYWVSEKDEGQTHAINKGLRRATGEIVTWLNADDLHFSDTLSVIADAFTRFPEDVIYGDYELITQRGTTFLRRYEIPFRREILFYGVNFIGQPSAFFRRSVIERFGLLDESYHYAMDHEFWLRIAYGGGSFRHIKNCLSKYRYHSDSKTVAAQEKFGAEMKRTRRKYQPSLGPLRERGLGYWARLKRQLIKLAYRGRVDWLGGNLNRIWYRRIHQAEQQRAGQ